ncbi:hypothetical protein R6Q59_011093 [Mikania micrantha]
MKEAFSVDCHGRLSRLPSLLGTVAKVGLHGRVLALRSCSEAEYFLSITRYSHLGPSTARLLDSKSYSDLGAPSDFCNLPLRAVVVVNGIRKMAMTYVAVASAEYHSPLGLATAREKGNQTLAKSRFWKPTTITKTGTRTRHIPKVKERIRALIPGLNLMGGEGLRIPISSRTFGGTRVSRLKIKESILAINRQDN